ncbi:MAG: uroporphyrinogen decarboxylase family protein [Rhodospirillales bacterium]|jgi:hypothetical protein|nr:uroporphyrinogen decarboxylase family protein [Rhodospirillales bacterium]
MDDARLEVNEKAGQEAFALRRQRMQDVIDLKEPDRVPYYLSWRFWAARQAGMTCEDAMYDPKALSAASRPWLRELQPDAYQLPHLQIAIGPPLETLDFKAIQWPGHGVDENVSYQYLDEEFITAAEYDDYLSDATGFFLRKYLPRIAKGIEGFQNLPDIPGFYYTGLMGLGRFFNDPGVRQALDTISKVGRQVDSIMEEAMEFSGGMEAEGFPLFSMGVTGAPFDQISDYMRGSKGAMLDMFRHKDKLLATLDQATKYNIGNVKALAKVKPGGHVFMPLHWGLGGFMSPDQFDTYYWPQLRRVIMATIDEGLVPYVFWEGNCEERLETIADIPPGKVIYKFEQTDLVKAKSVLSGVACVQGNVPASLLNTGTPEDVEEYCKNLIRDVGKGGGFILDGGAGVPDEAQVENVMAMANAARTHGQYG